MKKTIQTLVYTTALLIFSSLQSYGVGVGSASVQFGQPSKCTGKGICNMGSTSPRGGVSVNVDFVLLEDREAGFYTLTMQFNISLMSTANHDYLFQYFLYPDLEARPRFVFDKDYTIEDADLCRALGVNPGDITITPESCASDRNIEKLRDADIRLTYIIPMQGAEQQGR